MLSYCVLGGRGVCLCRGREVLAGVVSGHACMAGGPGHEGDMCRFSGGAVKTARECVCLCLCLCLGLCLLLACIGDGSVPLLGWGC